MDRLSIQKGLLAQLQEDKGEIIEGLNDNVGLRDGLGLDSIDVVTLVINIQDRFGVELRSDELEKVVKVGDLVDLLQLKLSEQRNAA